ncbi:MAG TPA: SMP-30/gluconolactonase/LRE family protein [Thermoleophilaceae bacterium]|nr:SMP-30/gluconolactonase/LRE family protein [Thermoleophilaceae bacterium]
MRKLEKLLDGGTFFEGARWHDGRWWVSDFYANRVLAVDADGSAETVMEVEQPSGLGWLPDGSLLAVSMTGHKIWRRSESGDVALHADISEFSRGEANDMVVDAHGRAYVGNYGYDLMAGEPPKAATLVRVDPDGTVSAAANGLHFPNAGMITPDGRTLLVNETTAARIAAFTIGDDGSLSDHRIWAQIAETPAHTTLEELLPLVEFAPDGGCLDAGGCVWAGDSLHHRAARIAAGGEILEEIEAPGDLVFYGCMLGGDDGHTMLLCAAPDWRLPAVEGATPSVLFTTRVEAGRAGWP